MGLSRSWFRKRLKSSPVSVTPPCSSRPPQPTLVVRLHANGALLVTYCQRCIHNHQQLHCMRTKRRIAQAKKTVTDVFRNGLLDLHSVQIFQQVLYFMIGHKYVILMTDRRYSKLMQAMSTSKISSTHVGNVFFYSRVFPTASLFNT